MYAESGSGTLCYDDLWKNVVIDPNYEEDEEDEENKENDNDEQDEDDEENKENGENEDDEENKEKEGEFETFSILKKTPKVTKWLTKEPGRQYIGSFHPEDPKTWSENLYNGNLNLLFHPYCFKSF